MAARHRMSPSRKLPRCKTQRRERERRVIHAELGIDEHVERVVAYDGRDHRRPRTTAAELHEAVGACLDLACDVIEARIEVIDEHLEAPGVELREPAAEITSRRADMEKGRCEADTKPLRG